MDRSKGYLREDLETLDPQARSEYLDKKVCEIVDHAAAHSPAFGEILKRAGAAAGDIRSVGDLAGLPITEKAELVALQRENLPFGGFEGEPLDRMRRIYVSPGPIYEPCEMVMEDDRWTQAFYAAGFRSGDNALVTFNFNMVPFAFMLDESLHQLGCRSIPTGVGNSDIQVQVLKDLQVEAYLGTPSFLNTLADKAVEMGLDPLKDLNLQVAFVAAEMLPESLRADLESRLGMMIRQSYGTADVGCLSYECRHMGGMHLAQDCVVEVVDPETGKPVEEGVPGEVVATVFNKTYPLIRFGTGDLSALSYETCECGRTAPRLTRIMGRVDQMTKVKGMFVHPSGVQQVGAKFGEIAACRLVVTRKDNKDVMTLSCELADASARSEELKARIQGSLKEALRVSGLVEFVEKGSLPDDGKLIDDQRVWD